MFSSYLGTKVRCYLYTDTSVLGPEHVHFSRCPPSTDVWIHMEPAQGFYHGESTGLHWGRNAWPPHTQDLSWVTGLWGMLA